MKDEMVKAGGEERFKAVVLDRDRNGAVWAFREWRERRSIDVERTDQPTAASRTGFFGYKIDD